MVHPGWLLWEVLLNRVLKCHGILISLSVSPETAEGRDKVASSKPVCMDAGLSWKLGGD